MNFTKMSRTDLTWVQSIQLVVFFTLIGLITLAGCADSTLDATDETDEIDVSEVQSLLNDQLNTTEFNEDSIEGIAVVMLDWVEREEPRSQQVMLDSRALALGFSEATLLKPPFEHETVSMGEVSILDADGNRFTLNEHLNRENDIAYHYGNRPGKRTRPVKPIPFSADADYDISINGSDQFDSANLTLHTPSNRIQLVLPESESAFNADEDLIVQWTDNVSDLPVAIRVMPARRPDRGQHNQRPPQRPKKAEPILVDPGVQEYTISADYIKQIRKNHDNEAIIIHVGQLFIKDESTNAGTIRVVSRLSDTVLLKGPNDSE